MRLCLVFSVDFGQGSERLVLPLRMRTGEGEFELTRADNGGVLKVLTTVRREGVSLVQGRQSLDGRRKEPVSIEVPEMNAAAQHGSDVIAVLAFLADVRMSLGSLSFQDRLIPEDQEDRKLLAACATDRIHHDYDATLHIRTFSLGTVDRDVFEKLLARRAGMQLFHEAMHLSRPVAKYRELWRVLESAFACQGGVLIELLANYQPAKELGFTPRELKRMEVLRGRASHAATKSGVDEVRSVNNEAARATGRLACLVEQVILTKKSWGYRTLAVERLAPLRSFVGPCNAVTLVRPRS